ncbi:hypothetical protein KPL71_015656 [Citrus sinensis]|uniref:Uncharacterized protein n=1 Tax=Citrus sinensis TaxID=2711 RepID=A0ACB8KLA4_CITSI|nr:hypothetical protein KPL71_015656 [Citrus sinensis]
MLRREGGLGCFEGLGVCTEVGVAFTGQLKLLAQWQALDPNRKEVQDTRQGTRMAVDAVVASIKRRAQTITTFEDIAEFGTAAANRDREIGELIAKAFEKGWGNDLQFLAGGNAPHSELQLYTGMTLDRGYLLPHFITNHKTKECIYFVGSALVLINQWFYFKGLAATLPNLMSKLHNCGGKYISASPVVVPDAKHRRLALHLELLQQDCDCNCSELP